MFKKQMQKYNEEELIILDRGFYSNEFDSMAINENFLHNLRILTGKIALDVFPPPDSESDAFLLTAQQLYYRGKIFDEIMKCLINNNFGRYKEK